jgi:hypothetical protein
MGIVLIQLLTGKDSMDARGLVETEEVANIASATYALAKGLQADTAKGALQTAKVLGEVAASCSAEVEKRKTPTQLLPQVELAYAMVVGTTLCPAGCDTTESTGSSACSAYSTCSSL